MRMHLCIDLQQTPANKPKVMLKILVGNDGGGEAEQFVFNFTSPSNARAEADAIKEVLSTAIQNVKAAASIAGGAGAGAGLGEGAGVGAGVTLGRTPGTAAPQQWKQSWDDDDRLRADVDLQQSLLRSNLGLQRIFMESLATKSDAVSNAQFVSQFWSTRLPLLRAHAIERSQTRGPYNVLSTLKPRVEDNVTKLNISKEQIALMFNQHPLVKRVYDENVPQLSEQQFWSRFFQSRLFKKLRGERISEADASDAVLDKYLGANEGANHTYEPHIPHLIDLEGNEENNPQRLGNRPDVDMRPSTLDKVPIIRTLNSLSEKIMANVAPVDRDPSAPSGMSEEQYNQRELQLKDLQGDSEADRIVLHIRDQSQFFQGANPVRQGEKEAELTEARLADLRNHFAQAYPNNEANLATLIQPHADSDEDDEDAAKIQNKKQYPPAIGTPISLAAASKQLFTSLRACLADESTDPSPAALDASPTPLGLSRPIFDRATLTHATATEFLHHFWSAFLSGRADRAAELASLADSLSRARARIAAVVADADAERAAEVERRRGHARQLIAAAGAATGTGAGLGVGKRAAADIEASISAVPGGGIVVERMLGPMIRALEKATTEYGRAVELAQAQEREGEGGS